MEYIFRLNLNDEDDLKLSMCCLDRGLRNQGLLVHPRFHFITSRLQRTTTIRYLSKVFYTASVALMEHSAIKGYYSTLIPFHYIKATT